MCFILLMYSANRHHPRATPSKSGYNLPAISWECRIDSVSDAVLGCHYLGEGGIKGRREYGRAEVREVRKRKEGEEERKQGGKIESKKVRGI